MCRRERNSKFDTSVRVRILKSEKNLHQDYFVKVWIFLFVDATREFQHLIYWATSKAEVLKLSFKYQCSGCQVFCFNCLKLIPLFSRNLNLNELTPFVFVYGSLCSKYSFSYTFCLYVFLSVSLPLPVALCFHSFFSVFIISLFFIPISIFLSLFLLFSRFLLFSFHRTWNSNSSAKVDLITTQLGAAGARL